MSTKLIILVENDVNLRHSIALILQRAGYTVTSTDRVDQALELLLKGQYNMLISDFNIPETREILLPKVPGIKPNLPIMILTDQSSAEVELESIIYGAHYLIKPVAPERLIDSVVSIVGMPNNSTPSDNHGVFIDPV
jgi:DNA-binding NtrC family response regulator